MSNTGYPDFQDARDYMAGLIGKQQLDSLFGPNIGVPFGPTQISVIPAGAHMVVRSIQLQLYVAATAGGFATPFLIVGAQNGLDGTHPGVTVGLMISFVEAKASSENMVTYVFPGPLVVSGGPAGNHLQVTGNGPVNVAAFSYSALIYSVLLS